jgi:thioesterase domain-containing protein/acyl carrier protein
MEEIGSKTAVRAETSGKQVQQVWRRSADPVLSSVEQPCWLVFADDFGLGDQIAFQLRGAQRSAVKVTSGPQYKRISGDTYVIRPDEKADYCRLMRTIVRKHGLPSRIVHLWPVQASAGAQADEFERAVPSILNVLGELQQHHAGPADVAVVSNSLQLEDDSPAIQDSVARLSGVISKEFPGTICRRIDIDATKLSLAQIAVQVIREHGTAFADPVVAYRGDERWVLSPLDAPPCRAAATANATALTEVEIILDSWWRQLLASNHISPDDDFFDLGGDSITAVQLFAKIKNTWGVDLGLSTIFEARTIRKLADLIEQTQRSAEPPHTSRSLVAIQPKGTQPRIYIISGVGGNVIKFQRLAFYLGENQPVFGLLPRGLDGKEPYFTRVEDMAAYYADAIQQSQPAGPYRLMGYSFGGLVAFETARQIVARGGEVSFVGLLDSAEPQYLDRLQKDLPAWQRYRGYKDYLAELFVGDVGFERLRKRFATKISSLTFRIYRRLGRSIPQDLGRMEYINLLAGTEYHPEAYSGKLTIFRSTARDAYEGTDRALGWGGLAAEIEVVDLPSNHFNILQDPNVRLLADNLKIAISSDPVKPTDQVAVSRS